jgi:hypothetical protein
MKNKDHVINLIEKLETKLAHLNFIVTRSEPLEVYTKTLAESQEIIDDIKHAINR